MKKSDMMDIEDFCVLLLISFLLGSFLGQIVGFLT